jgi:hypothetical protein
VVIIGVRTPKKTIGGVDCQEIKEGYMFICASGLEGAMVRKRAGERSDFSALFSGRLSENKE